MPFQSRIEDRIFAKHIAKHIAIIVVVVVVVVVVDLVPIQSHFGSSNFNATNIADVGHRPRGMTATGPANPE